jgi:hypothetical protein
LVLLAAVRLFGIGSLSGRLVGPEGTQPRPRAALARSSCPPPSLTLAALRIAGARRQA